MRVLVVDDSNHLTEGLQRELRDDGEFTVSYALDPLAARRLLDREDFDVVVVDVLYEHLYKAYERRRRERRVSLRTDSQFYVSGLTTLYEAGALPRRPGRVLWAIGMDSRELHMLLAYQELGVRAFCSKGPTPQGIADLKNAMRAAASRLAYSDPLLEAYLPRAEAPPLRSTLFEREIWRGIWRAFALGVHKHDLIATLLDRKSKTVRNEIPQMATRLTELDPGIDPAGEPSIVLAAYAESNWQFFLDDTVMRMFPPRLTGSVGE